MQATSLLALVHVCSVRKSHLRPSFECGVCGRYARRSRRVKSGGHLGRLRAVGADGRAQPVVQRQEMCCQPSTVDGICKHATAAGPEDRRVRFAVP